MALLLFLLETDFFLVSNRYYFAISNIKRLLSDFSSIFRSFFLTIFFQSILVALKTPSHEASRRVKPEKKKEKGLSENDVTTLN